MDGWLARNLSWNCPSSMNECMKEVNIHLNNARFWDYHCHGVLRFFLPQQQQQQTARYIYVYVLKQQQRRRMMKDLLSVNVNYLNANLLNLDVLYSNQTYQLLYIYIFCNYYNNNNNGITFCDVHINANELTKYRTKNNPNGNTQFSPTTIHRSTTQITKKKTTKIIQ